MYHVSLFRSVMWLFIVCISLVAHRKARTVYPPPFSNAPVYVHLFEFNIRQFSWWQIVYLPHYIARVILLSCYFILLFQIWNSSSSNSPSSILFLMHSSLHSVSNPDKCRWLCVSSHPPPFTVCVIQFTPQNISRGPWSCASDELRSSYCVT